MSKRTSMRPLYIVLLVISIGTTASVWIYKNDKPIGENKIYYKNSAKENNRSDIGVNSASEKFADENINFNVSVDTKAPNVSEMRAASPSCFGEFIKDSYPLESDGSEKPSCDQSSGPNSYQACYTPRRKGDKIYPSQIWKNSNSINTMCESGGYCYAVSDLVTSNACSV